MSIFLAKILEGGGAVSKMFLTFMGFFWVGGGGLINTTLKGDFEKLRRPWSPPSKPLASHLVLVISLLPINWDNK